MVPRQSIDIPLQRTVCAEADLLPVSKFSKYQAHLVASNEFFIVYTTSKSGVVRVIKQEDGSNWALDTHYSVNFLHLWESETPSSLLAVGSDDGHISIWELPYPDKSVPAAPKDYQLKKTLSLEIDLAKSRLICKSIANTRYMTFSLSNSIYVYKIPEDANDQAASSGSAVIEFDENVHDFFFHPTNIAVVTSTNKVATLFLIKYALVDLLSRKFTHFKDFKLSRSRLHTKADVWVISQRGSAAGVNILVRDNKKLLIANDKLQFSAELDLTKHIKNFESYVAQYDSTSETLLFSSASNPQSCYLVSVKYNQSSITLSLLTIVEFPTTFEPLDFSVTKSFSAQTQGKKVVDLYIFHTKGLSILPVSIVKQKKFNKVSKEPVSDLHKAIQKCLNDYRTSKNLPRNTSHEVFQAVDSVISHSGIIDVIVDHVEKKLEEKFEKTLAALLDQKLNNVFDERFTQLANDAVGSALAQRRFENTTERFNEETDPSDLDESSDPSEFNESSESSESKEYIEFNDSNESNESNTTNDSNEFNEFNASNGSNEFNESNESNGSNESNESNGSNLTERSLEHSFSGPKNLKDSVAISYKQPTVVNQTAHAPTNTLASESIHDSVHDYVHKPTHGFSQEPINEPACEPVNSSHITVHAQARVKELWNDTPIYPESSFVIPTDDSLRKLDREEYRRQQIEDLNDLEQELLDIIESWDLGYAVRYASAHVAETSLTKVLTVFERTDEEHLRLTDGSKESRLREQLRTGDPLILLSFIAVLSADLNKPNFEYPDLNLCLMWMKKFIEVINDNRERYQASMPLVVQVYNKTREILRNMNFYSGLTSGVIALLNEIIG